MSGTHASRLAAAAVASVLIAPVVLGAVGCADPGDERQRSEAVQQLSEDRLIGRWQAPEPANQRAFVEFTEYGLWFGSDGCNRSSGSWRLDDAGELRTAGLGVSTQGGCDNVPIPEAISTMRSAELTGEGALRLTTIHEEQLTLVQTRQEGVSLVGRWVGPASKTSLTMVEFEPDGTLTATTGCGDMQGTWSLAPAERTEYRDPASDLTYIPGPGVLRIGPQTEHVPICTDAQVPPMLENDTEYSLSFGDAGSLVLQPLPVDFTGPGFGHLPLRRLADASEPVH